MIVRSAPYLLYILFAVSLITGCDSQTNTPDSVKVDSFKVDYEFRVRNLRPLRDGEVFALWVRQRTDTQWTLASDTNFNKFQVRDSTVIFGRFFPKFHP